MHPHACHTQSTVSVTVTDKEKGHCEESEWSGLGRIGFRRPLGDRNLTCFREMGIGSASRDLGTLLMLSLNFYEQS